MNKTLKFQIRSQIDAESNYLNTIVLIFIVAGAIVFITAIMFFDFASALKDSNVLQPSAHSGLDIINFFGIAGLAAVFIFFILGLFTPNTGKQKKNLDQAEEFINANDLPLDEFLENSDDYLKNFDKTISKYKAKTK